MRKRKRRTWKSAEVVRLRRMARRRTPAPLIGAKLHRTEDAIRQKAFALGLSLESR